MEEKIRCSTAPGKIFKTRDELHMHYQSDLHRYNLRRKAAGLTPITEDIFNKMKLAMQQREELAKRELANKKLDHVKLSKRAYQQQQNENQGKKIEEKGKLSDDNNNTSSAAATSSASDSNNLVKSSSNDENDEEEEIIFDEEEMKKPVDLAQCFFDQNVSNNMEENLDYMRRYYGFMLPEEEYLVDKEGIVKYCAQKIGVGKLCLYCERHFRSKEACVKHMLDKGHCKIRWEYEEDIEEFSDFYDFDKESEGEIDEETGERKPSTKKKSKQTMEMTESGEYIFRDGNKVRRVGVRQFRVYYRQKLRAPKEQKASYVANAKEELVRFYKNAGMDAGDAHESASLAVVRAENSSMRFNPVARREMREKRSRVLDNYKYQLAAGILNNLLMKHAIAGSNRGVGHGVHG